MNVCKWDQNLFSRIKRNKECVAKMRTNRFSKQLIWASAVLVLGITLMLGWNYWQTSQPGRDRNQLYVELLERSGQFNRDLPKLLDQQTRFERAEVVNYGMRFVYALIAVDRFQHDINSVQQQVEPFMLNSFCTAKSMQFYRQQAEFVEYLYQDRNNMNLFTLRFTRADCDSAEPTRKSS